MEIIVWPILVLILSVIFMLTFKKDISNLIARISGVKLPGFKATTEQEIINKPFDKVPSDELMKSFDSKFLLEQEKKITDDLRGRNIIEDVEKNKILIRFLAATQIQLTFERLYSHIYGSQLNILQSLNSNPNGDTKDAIIQIYSQASQMYPEVYKTYSFDDYIGFMINFNLVEQKNGRYHITYIGKDFLTFIIQSGKSLIRYY